MLQEFLSTQAQLSTLKGGTGLDSFHCRQWENSSSATGFLDLSLANLTQGAALLSPMEAHHLYPLMLE